MQRLPLKRLQKLFQAYPQVKLVYLFGSCARQEEGALSDYDFAFYLAPRLEDIETFIGVVRRNLDL